MDYIQWGMYPSLTAAVYKPVYKIAVLLGKLLMTPFSLHALLPMKLPTEVNYPVPYIKLILCEIMLFIGYLTANLLYECIAEEISIELEVEFDGSCKYF